jgi:DNA helicase II / ATP-dependent DNA helicase PcrA
MKAAFGMGMLNPQQRECVMTIEGPVLILAGAGTGKTRTITARMSYMVDQGILPQTILAVTFTNKAAAEMRERVIDMVADGKGKKIVLGTFHAFCVKLLRIHAEKIGYKKNWNIYTQSEQISLIKRVIVKLMGKDESCDPSKVQSRISSAKNMGVDLGDPETDTDAALYQAYQDEMRALNAMDFDDLLLLGVQLLEEHEDVRFACRDQHRYIMVDEFQDTNSLQMRLLNALVGPPYNVCVVGDDDQSIYGWRGADITNILEFEKFFPNPHVIKLEENYRSTTPILHTANSLIVHNAGRRPKTLWSRLPGTDNVRLLITQDDKEEAEMIGKEIENGHFQDKQPFENYAVLFRTNDQSRILEQTFRARKIPYRVIGARSFFDRREVKDVLSYLRVFHNPHDDMSLLRIINVPTRGIGTGTAELAREDSMARGCSIWVSLCDPAFIRKIPEKNRAAIRGFVDLVVKYNAVGRSPGVLLGEMTEKLLHEIQYREFLEKGAKKPEEMEGWMNGINAFLEQIGQYDDRNRTEGLAGFIDEICLNDEREDRDKDDITKKKGVCLITMHASKGLEFPYVYLPGCEQGIIPHKRSYEENRLDEERRLFYVALTRAMKRLTMSYVLWRTKYGQRQSQLPSPFFKELDRKYIDELDYAQHMKQPATVEESQNFIAGLKAMLAGD